MSGVLQHRLEIRVAEAGQVDEVGVGQGGCSRGEVSHQIAAIAGTEDECVAARSPRHGVAAFAAIETVVAAAAVERVRSTAAVEGIVSGVSVEEVVTGISAQGVVVLTA